METKNGKTYTITGGPLRPHEYITIRREMTARDKTNIANSMTAIGGTKANPTVEFRAGEGRLTALKLMIVEWQRTEDVEGPNGQINTVSIPLTAKSIEEMPGRISDYVNKIIDRFNPEYDDDDFLPDADGRSVVNSLPMMSQ